MTRTVHEAFERGTATFNAHDINGFAEVLSDDVVFEAPGGIHGTGKSRLCAARGCTGSDPVMWGSSVRHLER